MSNNPASGHKYDAPIVVRSSDPARSASRSAPHADDLMKPPVKKPLRKEILGYVLSQWLILGLGVFILLAWAFPSVGKNGGAIRAEITVKWVGVGLIFFITGITLSTRALINQALNFKLHIVTQAVSFPAFSGVVFAIVKAVIAGGEGKIDVGVLAGLVTMGVLPTTIASNVAMTRNAGGDVEAATAEVVVGNVLGTFITPLLLSMYMSPLERYGFMRPEASGGAGIVNIYVQMAKQLSISLIAPLIFGQFVQITWPEQSKMISTKLHLNIIGQVLMLLLVWSTFCNQFATGVFTKVTHESVIFIAFINVALYGFMSLVCVCIARLPWLALSREIKEERELTGLTRFRLWLGDLRFDRKETAAICFCGAAKGLVLGAPLISIMFSAYPQDVQAVLTVPISLYQGTQIMLAQFSTRAVKAWIRRGELIKSDEETNERHIPQ